MKRWLVLLVLVAPVLLLAPRLPSGQDRPEPDPRTSRALAALPYLASDVPEQRIKAEAIVAAAAEHCFDELVARLADQPRDGREALLRLLAATNHPGRVELCLRTLCSRESRRAERVIAARALPELDPARLLDALRARLDDTNADAFVLAQCQLLLGYVATGRAQTLAEEKLAAAGAGTRQAARLEVALLRSILASSGAEPAWARWQKRHASAPRCGLRELQDALRDLARPTAIERLAAEERLETMVGNNVWLLLALGHSNLPERAAFGLGLLKRKLTEDAQPDVLALMLDMVSTARQETALLAIDVAVACSPPSATELLALRPTVSHDAIARLESIIEALRLGGNLGELRRQHARLGAQLRPLLARRGAVDFETMALLRDLENVRAQLEFVETQWRQGWRSEFESDVLGMRPE